MSLRQKTAIVLLNLGGPDSLEAVQPFLYNLFSDPAIVKTQKPLRLFLAWLISHRRAPYAQENYRKIGGASPLLSNTEAQAQALVKELTALDNFRCFICMRYWSPRAAETAKQLRDWGAEQVILLPLYPQFSTTTTASSFDDWDKAAQAVGLNVQTHKVCCYPRQNGVIEAMADLIAAGVETFTRDQQRTVRILFSAHGLPQKIVDQGDPYQWQIEQTVAAIMEQLEERGTRLDHRICYQSRIGPLKWLGPSTEEEICQAGTDRIPILLVPVAFVSEHVETLVELDMEYRKLSEEVGVPAFYRVSTVGTHPKFIKGLADLVRMTLDGITVNPRSEKDDRLCPAEFCECPNKK